MTNGASSTGSFQFITTWNVSVSLKKKMEFWKFCIKKNYHCNEVCSSITKIATAKTLWHEKNLFVIWAPLHFHTRPLATAFIFNGLESIIATGSPTKFGMISPCRCLFKIIYQCILEQLTVLCNSLAAADLQAMNWVMIDLPLKTM